MAAKSKYNYIEDNISQNYAPRQYSAPFTTQALPQLNFAQYAFQDPRFALGMLIGNAVGANILNRKQKEADQQLWRQDNPVSMPDNVPLYDTSSTPPWQMARPPPLVMRIAVLARTPRRCLTTSWRTCKA